MITSVSDSKFNMWRGCVAIIYLDNALAPEEKLWVENKCKTLPLSDDQRKILLNDLAHGLKLDEVIEKITDRVDLAFLVNTFLVLGNIDKNFSPIEKEAFKKLEAKVLKGINLVEIETEIDKLEVESYKESEVYKDHNSASLFEKMHHSFCKMINPGDYKFPKKN